MGKRDLICLVLGVFVRMWLDEGEGDVALALEDRSGMRGVTCMRYLM
jgi:hypothetical protein